MNTCNVEFYLYCRHSEMRTSIGKFVSVFVCNTRFYRKYKQSDAKNGISWKRNKIVSARRKCTNSMQFDNSKAKLFESTSIAIPLGHVYFMCCKMILFRFFKKRFFCFCFCFVLFFFGEIKVWLLLQATNQLNWRIFFKKINLISKVFLSLCSCLKKYFGVLFVLEKINKLKKDESYRGIKSKRSRKSLFNPLF